MIFSGIYAVANKGFYIMVFVTLMLVFAVIYVTRWLDYWEILPNEILHHHGPLSDLERYPTMNLKFDKEIPDVLEWALLGAGRLVLHVPNVSKALVLDNVLFISAKEKALKKRDEPSRSAGHDRPGSRRNGDLRREARVLRLGQKRRVSTRLFACRAWVCDAAPSGRWGFRSGSTLSGGSVKSPAAAQPRSSSKFGQDRAVHDLFDIAKPAGDIGSVEHAMVVDQLDDDAAGGRVDRAVGQRGR